MAAADALAHTLARRQLLLVLDNCEHVIGAAAELCGRLLLGAADLLEQIPEAGRAVLIATGLLSEDFTADDLRRAIPRLKEQFQGTGFTAAQAATIILDGVRSGAWRILVGEEAKMLDKRVRANPEAPFDYKNYAEMYGPLIAQAQAHESRTPEP